KQWVELLKKIADTKPKAIVIDAAFSKIIGDKNTLNQIPNLEVPIFVGGYIHQQKLIHHQVYEPTAPEQQNPIKINSDINLPTSPYFYSFAANYQRIFKSPGHFMYDN